VHNIVINAVIILSYPIRFNFSTIFLIATTLGRLPFVQGTFVQVPDVQVTYVQGRADVWGNI